MCGSCSLLRREPYNVFLHRPHKAIAVTPTALNEPLRPPTVANGLAGQRNTALERRITNKLARPYMRAELVFGDYMVAMLKEILQD